MKSFTTTPGPRRAGPMARAITLVALVAAALLMALTGTAAATVVNGTIHAAGRTPATVLANTDLGGQTLVAGIYKSAAALRLTGTVTLDGQNRPGSVFIFQAGSTLVTASNSTVLLINGATACNVFWQVGSSATLGSNTTFVGSILALTSITVQAKSTVAGRVLAGNGQVSLDTNTTTSPDCATPPTTTTAPPTTTTVPPTTTTVPTTTVPTTTVPTTTTTVPTTTTAPTTTTKPGGGQQGAAYRGGNGSGNGGGSYQGVDYSRTTAQSTAAAHSSANGPGTHAWTGTQVRKVPVGSVDAGDGSSDPGTGFGYDLPAAAQGLTGA